MNIKMSLNFTNMGYRKIKSIAAIGIEALGEGTTHRFQKSSKDLQRAVDRCHKYLYKDTGKLTKQELLRLDQVLKSEQDNIERIRTKVRLDYQQLRIEELENKEK